MFRHGAPQKRSASRSRHSHRYYHPRTEMLESRYYFNVDFVAPMVPLEGEVYETDTEFDRVRTERGLEDLNVEVLVAIQEGTQQRYEDAGSWASGNLGNVVTFFSAGYQGDGCNAWKDWMVANLGGLSNQATNIEPVKVYFTSETLGLGVHKPVRFQVRDDPSGTWYVADPWADPDNPIWRQDVYMKSQNLNIYDYDSGAVKVSLDSLPGDPVPPSSAPTMAPDPHRCVRGSFEDVKVPAIAPQPTQAPNSLSPAEVDAIFTWAESQGK